MDSGDLRNLKDFLLLYNKISEDCFKKCVYNMTQRALDDEESSCISSCTQKHIFVNHKMMELFSEINPAFQKRKMEENEAELRKIQAEQAKANETTSGNVENAQQTQNSVSMVSNA